MLINCSWARASWYQFADRPYPSLDAAYADLIESRSGNVAGRILTRPTWEARSPAPGLFRTQILNFPTITGALSVGGYDTFVETSAPNRLALERLERDPAGAARAYGVRWLIWDRIFERPVFSMNPFWATLEQPTVLERKILFDVRAASSLALNVDGLKVYRLPDADPMAFLAGSEKRPLTVNLDMRGATVDTAGIAPGSEIVVNLLWRPWLRAFSDGRPTLIHSDEWGRVVAQVGGATRRMTVSYRPPWAVSSFAGLAIAGIGAAFGWVLRRLTA
jgi:hypothetical protein